MKLLSKLASLLRQLRPLAIGTRQALKKVTVSGSGFVIDGKPFFVRGVTYSKQPSEEDFARLEEMGANAIRTWSTNENTPLLLDLAERHGIKVLLGIWLRHGRPGAEDDDSFDWIGDRKGRREQMNRALEAVRRFRRHPALLGWGIGNEVTLNIETELEKIAYAKYLEKLCRKARRLDPNHPISSISAWLTDVPYWEGYCPSLDIYGINVYGPGVFVLPEEYRKKSVKKPYFLGEFGVMGEWDVHSDANGVKVEPSDQEKYDIYARQWQEVKTKSGSQFGGGFLFNFGDSFKFASVWLDFFIQGAIRPSYWGARKALSGKEPIHPLPQIGKFILSDSRQPHPPEDWVEAKVAITHGSGKVSFYYNQRVGDRLNRDSVKPLTWKTGESPGHFHIRLPTEPAPTKIYVFVQDEHSNLAIASASILVQV